MDNKLEFRSTSGKVNKGENEESRTIEGYALLFGVPSDGLDFEEVIVEGALDGVIEKSDVFALLNHGNERGILARSYLGEGSLFLDADKKGLKYRFEAPKTALGDEVLEYLRRGEISQSSFAFTVENDKWEKRSDGTWKRTINKIAKLYDVSPVYNAAYSRTSVYLRGKEMEEARLAEEQKRLEEETRSIPESYYEAMERNFKL